MCDHNDIHYLLLRKVQRKCKFKMFKFENKIFNIVEEGEAT